MRVSGPRGADSDVERFAIAVDEPALTLLSPRTLSVGAAGTVKLSLRCDAPRGACDGTKVSVVLADGDATATLTRVLRK